MHTVRRYRNLGYLARMKPVIGKTSGARTPGPPGKINTLNSFSAVANIGVGLTVSQKDELYKSIAALASFVVTGSRIEERMDRFMGNLGVHYTNHISHEQGPEIYHSKAHGNSLTKF